MVGVVVGHALPPDVAVIGQGTVGEDGITLRDGIHRDRVCFRPGTRCHPEETGLGIYRPQPAIVTELHPGDVVADSLDLPAFHRGNEHGEVCLAAHRREGTRDELDDALRAGQLDDQHVLGHPALVAGHRRGDPQREALLAQKGVAAVARAERPDLTGFRVMDDVLVVCVAGPRNVLLAFLERHSHRVDTGHELPVLSQHFKCAGAHAGHDPHRTGYVSRVSQLNADVGDRRAERAHRERQHVHGPALHRALEQAVQGGAHLLGRPPVIGRTGVLFLLGADDGAVFDTGDVPGVRTRQIRVGSLGFRELRESAAVDEPLSEALVLVRRSVTPQDRVGLGQLGDFLHPGEQLRVVGGRRHLGGFTHECSSAPLLPPQTLRP